MKEYPFVSIIILSYNGHVYLKDCLNSVLDQDYPREAYEIIVADNASKDNSVDLVRSLYGEDVEIVEFGRNHGFAKGNNLAVEYAKGNLLVFLNQDTIVHKLWLGELVRGLEEAGFIKHDYTSYSPLSKVTDLHLSEVIVRLYLVDLSSDLVICYRVGLKGQMDNDDTNTIFRLGLDTIWSDIRKVWCGRSKL